MPTPSQCPLCQSNAATLKAPHVFGDTAHQHSFFECRACSVIFLWPRLTPDQEREFYVNEFEKFMTSRNSSGGFDWTGPEKHIASNMPQRRRRERYLAPYYQRAAQTQTANLLEIGCSSGFMLYGLDHLYGLRCVGVEPSGAFGEFVRARKLACYGSLEELKASSSEKFSLITNFFVLEHIQEPVEFIRSLYDLLNPGGHLIMEIPNAMDPLVTLYPTEAFDKFYWSIAHPWYFTPKSMEFLLREKCGFTHNVKLFGDQRYDIGNHTKWLRNGKPGGQGDLDHVFSPAFHELFQRELIQSGYCDTLVAVVTKGSAV